MCETTLRETVRLPEGGNVCEWFAKNVIEFYGQLTTLYDPISEFCTCPQMTAGPGFSYLWSDDDSMTPMRVSAPEYVRRLFDWVNRQIENEAIFPSMNSAFPPNFEDIVRNIMKRLFRIYAHVYHHHPREVQSLGMTQSLNMSFRYFVLFVDEFDLIDQSQLEPLRELIDEIIAAS